MIIFGQDISDCVPSVLTIYDICTSIHGIQTNLDCKYYDNSLSNSGFIIDEAEVDDEVDEDDEWEDGANELGIVNEVDEIGPTAREIEIRRRGNLWE